MNPHLVVVGVPKNRRVRLFRDAVLWAGLSEPQVVSWRDVLGGADLPIPPGGLVRIDSPGEDAEIDGMLRGPGDPARVGGGATWYRGFHSGLRRIRAAVAASPGALLLGDVDELAVMFDKRLCHARLRAAAVPVPPALPGPVPSYRELRHQMAAHGWSRVFVKPAHGSSASGVVALQVRGDEVRAVTSAELISAGCRHVALRNSLRVRTYGDESDVAAIVDALAPDGVHVERWFPKASLAGHVFDLRVVVVGGVPTHAVVRLGRTPMTNLHLGGMRGDLDVVRARLGDATWQTVLDVCADTAGCFPGSLAVGVDVLIGSNWRSVAVAEVNGFGDLLPGLTGLPGTPGEGLDTYAAQLAAMINGWRGHPDRVGQEARASCGT